MSEKKRLIQDLSQEIAARNGLFCPDIELAAEVSEGVANSGYRNGRFYIELAELEVQGQNVAAHEVAHVLAIYNNQIYRQIAEKISAGWKKLVEMKQANQFDQALVTEVASLFFIKGMYEEMLACFIGLKYTESTDPIEHDLVKLFDRNQAGNLQTFTDFMTELGEFTPKGIKWALDAKLVNFLTNNFNQGNQIGVILAEWLAKTDLDQKHLFLLDPTGLPCLLSFLQRYQGQPDQIPNFILRRLLKFPTSRAKLPELDELN